MLQYNGDSEELIQFVGEQSLKFLQDGSVQILTKEGYVFIEDGKWVAYLSGGWHVFSEKFPESINTIKSSYCC